MDPITKTIVAKSVLKARDELDETFVVVSHDMDFIINCCDRAAFMKGGKILKIGKPEEIIKEFDVEEERSAEGE
jgi:methyl coenzyme M reductase system subunit A2